MRNSKHQPYKITQVVIATKRVWQTQALEYRRTSPLRLRLSADTGSRPANCNVNLRVGENTLITTCIYQLYGRCKISRSKQLYRKLLLLVLPIMCLLYDDRRYVSCGPICFQFNLVGYHLHKVTVRPRPVYLERHFVLLGDLFRVDKWYFKEVEFQDQL